VSADDAARVLVLNCGSSSVRYRLVEPLSGTVRATGLVERIGETDGRLAHRWMFDSTEAGEHIEERTFVDHAQALDAVISAFSEHGPDLRERLAAVGHRVVHGGARFADPVVVDDAVLSAIDELAVLAPLHNPASATGIRTARDRLPGVPHVAVFDTAFHATIPPEAATYALPHEWRTTYHVRRYGFHGTSHAYVSRETARLLGRPNAQTNVIVLHLGNGASACAVRGGRSVDTSMGLTPLAGLLMGTRSGDVDPAIHGHLARVAGMTTEEVEDALNTQSGLKGLAGVADMREVVAHAQAGGRNARLALDVYCYRVRSYVGAYYAALGRVDAITFTAGVGENSPEVREQCLDGLEGLGIRVDPARNHAPPDPDEPAGGRIISPDGEAVTVFVVATDEEREIAAQTLEVVTA
jgi:acetate kinase